MNDLIACFAVAVAMLAAGHEGQQERVPQGPGRSMLPSLEQRSQGARLALERIASGQVSDTSPRALQMIEMGAYPSAEEVLKTALSENGNRTGYLQLLAETLLRQGRNQEALDALTRLIDIQRGEFDRGGRLRAGLALCRMGRQAESAALWQPEYLTDRLKGDFERAAAPRPATPTSLEAAWLLAIHLDDRFSGSPLSSQPYYLSLARDLVPDNPVINFQLGLVHYRHGSKSDAAQYFEAAVRHGDNEMKRRAEDYLRDGRK